jgi:hypothetical protein
MVVTDFSFKGIKDEIKKPEESIIEVSNENEEVLNRFAFTQQE